MDGNGRWAAQRRLSPVEGHRAGAENLGARLRDAAELGVEELTAFAFSTENWGRPSSEVTDLVSLIGEYAAREAPGLNRHGVRIRFIGRPSSRVPAEVIERIERAEELTHENTRMTLTIPFNYGSRAE